MGALANLLPGVREVRASLAAGYIWLLLLWLWCREAVPSENQAKGIWGDIYALAETVGPVGTAIAASFASYLIGSLSIGVWSTIAGIVERPFFELVEGGSRGGSHIFVVGAKEVRFDPPPALTIPASELSVRGHRSLVGSAQDGAAAFEEAAGPLEEPSILIKAATGRRTDYRNYMIMRPIEELQDKLVADLGYSMPVAQVSAAGVFERLALPRLLFDDLGQVNTRLIGEEAALYAAVDRFRAEGELRTAIVAPMSTAVVYFAESITWFLVPLLLPTLAIWIQGVLRRRAANDLLADAIQLGRVKAPTLERMMRASRLPIQDGVSAELREAIQSVLTELDYVRARAKEVFEGGEEWNYALPLPNDEWRKYRSVLARELDEATLQSVYQTYKLADRVNRTRATDDVLAELAAAADDAERSLRVSLRNLDRATASV